MRWLIAASWPAALTIVSFVWFRVGRAAGIDRGYLEGVTDCWAMCHNPDIPDQRGDDATI